MSSTTDISIMMSKFRVDGESEMTDNCDMGNNIVNFAYLPSPFGDLLVAGSDDLLIAVHFPTDLERHRADSAWRYDERAFAETARQFGQYFSGQRIEFSLPTSIRGDRFQRSVWRAMSDIPYGETRSYGEIARQIGETAAASRSVGKACGQNPLPIIVPCHRVVGADGSLTGFGGGLAIKRYLLDLEFRIRPPADTLFGAGR